MQVKLMYLRSENLKHESHKVLIILEFLCISFIFFLIVSNFHKNFPFSSYLYRRIKDSFIYLKLKEKHRIVCKYKFVIIHQMYFRLYAVQTRSSTSFMIFFIISHQYHQRGLCYFRLYND